MLKENLLSELERVVQEIKIERNSDELFQKRFDFVKEEFTKNIGFLNDCMEENGLSVKAMYNALHSEIINLDGEMVLAQSDDWFQIKYILNTLAVKLGYREIWNPDKKEITPETQVQQCPLYITKKGEEIYKEYRSICA